MSESIIEDIARGIDAYESAQCGGSGLWNQLPPAMKNLYRSRARFMLPGLIALAYWSTPTPEAT